MSAAKAKGTAAETAVAQYLNTWGWLAERRALSGANDKGDIAGIPGVVWEVKAAGRLAIPEWLRETEAERINANASVGLLVVKPKGVGSMRTGDWWVIQKLSQTASVMKQAGY